MPGRNNETMAAVQLLELLRNYTDESQPLSQNQLRALAKETMGTDSCLGYKNTFTRRLYAIADALNRDENGEYLEEKDWKIVFPGYKKQEEGAKNGKIWYRHPLTGNELDEVCELIRESYRWTPEKAEDLVERLRRELAFEKLPSDRGITSDSKVLDYTGLVTPAVSETLAFIQKAMEQGLKITFNLTRMEEDGSQGTDYRKCIVTPYWIVNYDNTFYLLGLWHLESGETQKNTIRVFDVSRIADVNYAYTNRGYRSRGKYIGLTRKDAVSDMKRDALWKKQVCYNHLGCFAKEPVTVRFETVDAEDYTFIYRAFSSECLTLEDHIFSVVCTADFFVDWAMKHADKIRIIGEDESTQDIKKQLKIRLETALKNLQDDL